MKIGLAIVTIDVVGPSAGCEYNMPIIDQERAHGQVRSAEGNLEEWKRLMVLYPSGATMSRQWT